MFLLDGLTSFVVVPNWGVMLMLEALTVVLEATVIGFYWWFKEGRLRWFEVLGVVTVANILSAGVGIGIYYLISPAYSDGYYVFGDFSGLFLGIIIIILTVAILDIIISKFLRKDPTIQP